MVVLALPGFRPYHGGLFREDPAMRSPRLSLGTMMIGVALLALVCLAGRKYFEHFYFHTTKELNISGGIQAAVDGLVEYPAGQPVPIEVSYQLQFTGKKAPVGTSCLVMCEVWLEDVDGQKVVDGYTFDARLTIGGREAASGEFTWEAITPHPGRYFPHCRVFMLSDRRWG
jgi:hypothetical protein